MKKRTSPKILSTLFVTKGYWNHTYRESCIDCGKTFIVYEIMQVSVCNKCYRKNSEYYDSLDLRGIIWLAGMMAAGAIGLSSLLSLNWIGLLIAVGVAIISFLPLVLFKGVKNNGTC